MSKSCKINRIEITDESISSRGGVHFFTNYLNNTGFFDLCNDVLGDMRKSSKGIETEKIVKQLMAAFVDGRGDTMTDFNLLRQDPSQCKLLELNESDMAGADIMKRFFSKFKGSKHKILRKIFDKIFQWRLNQESPEVIILDMDTMVLDNDDALKREGCNPTYKKVKGFQNLQITWRGCIVDALFRSGEKHSNHGKDAQNIIRKTVKTIRSSYSQNVPIIITIDSGFLDQKLLRIMEEELNIGYVVSGKLYNSVTKEVEQLDEKYWKKFTKGKTSWYYTEFESSLGVWHKQRRTIYSSIAEENNQLCLRLSRPESVIYTNIGYQPELDELLKLSSEANYSTAKDIITLAHQRGDSELVHRSFKEFMGKEHLPFKNYGMNGAYYYFQAICHSLFECFRLDILPNLFPNRSYPNTIRRKVLDIAAKIVKTAGQTILKIQRSNWELISIDTILSHLKMCPKMVC